MAQLAPSIAPGIVAAGIEAAQGGKLLSEVFAAGAFGVEVLAGGRFLGADPGDFLNKAPFRRARGLDLPLPPAQQFDFAPLGRP